MLFVFFNKRLYFRRCLAVPQPAHLHNLPEQINLDRVERHIRLVCPADEHDMQLTVCVPLRVSADAVMQALAFVHNLGHILRLPDDQAAVREFELSAVFHVLFELSPRFL